MKFGANFERLRSSVKWATKQVLGRTLVTLRPDIARKIEAGGIDAHLSHFRDVSLAERLILEAVIARRQAEGATADLVQSHAAYWARRGASRALSDAGCEPRRRFLDLAGTTNETAGGVIGHKRRGQK